MSRWLLLVLLACSANAWAAAPPAPTEATRARARRIDEANRLHERGMAFFRAGRWPEAIKSFKEELRIRRALYPRDRYLHGRPDLALNLNNLAGTYCFSGDYARAEPLFQRALEMFEALYPREVHPRGRPEMANTLYNLAQLHYFRGEYAASAKLHQRALKMREDLYPKEHYPHGHLELAQSLTNLAVVHESQGEYVRAEPLHRRAVKMCERLYPPERYPNGHPDLARSFNNLAKVYFSQGDYARAEPLFRRTVTMNQALYPKEGFPQGHPELATSLNNLGMLHFSEGKSARAETLLRRALEMCERLYPGRLYPRGHPDLATSLNNLALLRLSQGEADQAEKLYQRALKMREDLYPKERYPHGHPLLALSLDNLAALYCPKEKFDDSKPLFDKTETLLRRALEMREALYPRERYPNGHPDLVRSLNNLAMLFMIKGQYARANALFQRCREMGERLYPRERYPLGHPDLALCLNNHAKLYLTQGEYTRAEPLFRRALTMNEALYPKQRFPQGHSSVALSLTNLATLHLSKGEPEKAAPLYRRVVKMRLESLAALASSAAETTALNYLASLPSARDAYLSVTRRTPSGHDYLAVWQSKAALARIYEQRYLAVLAAASPQAQALWNDIRGLRRERERLLLAPAGGASGRTPNQRLDEIDEQIARKQSDLLPLLPELKRSKELARATPNQLSQALPAETALVDLLRYVLFEQDPRTAGEKGWKRTAHYVAFVVTRRGVKRVELGKAKPIEELLELWRRAIQEGSSSESNYARKLHERLWSPLKEHLPARTSLVHVSPDAALNRLPWSALLDGKSGRILLEEHAVAVVPHGVFLLDRLTTEKPPRLERPTFLVVGGLDYDRPPRSATELAMRGPVGESVKWPALPGSQQEIKQIVELARTNRLRLLRREGVSAGVATLLADLPRAQTAHLATHGFFADEKFRTAWQLDESLFQHTEFITGGTARRFGAAARSPMVLSGLVCSGANRPGTANRGVLTAEAIAGLDLRRLELAVLSACETGLGDRAGGEAVYGLVRGFHVAGARNVAASLWQVEDESTAALMVLFYRHLWGKEPLGSAEALRRAQLALYREPARIKEWSQGRGPLPTPVVARTKPADKPAAGRTSPARAWAAFVLSGPGD